MKDMTEGQFTVEHDVVFGEGGGRPLRADIYRPAGQGTGFGLLLVHGGGWRQGSRENMVRLAVPLAKRGYLCFVNEYRLSGEAPWPAQIHDVKAALRYMRAEAGGLGIDAGLISAIGCSAGAHLVLMLAGTPGVPSLEGEGGHAGVATGISAAAAFYAPTDLHRIRHQEPVSALLGEGATDADFRAASPLDHAGSDFPPTFLAHGTDDKVVSWRASRQMFDALEAARVAAELHLLSGLPHAFDREPEYAEVMSDMIDRFLARHVGRGIAQAAAQ